MQRRLIWIYIGISLAAAPIGCAPPEPDDACVAYVACQAEYDAALDTGPVDTSRYQADGDCWFSADAAAICAQECIDANAALAAAAADEGIDAPSCTG